MLTAEVNITDDLCVIFMDTFGTLSNTIPKKGFAEPALDANSRPKNTETTTIHQVPSMIYVLFLRTLLVHFRILFLK